MYRIKNVLLDRCRVRERLHERGFTLIELMVVIVIIGILAAIAIPSFLGQRESAWDTTARFDLRNTALAAEAFADAHDGSYSGMDLATLRGSAYGLRLSPNNELDPISVTASGSAYSVICRNSAGLTSHAFTLTGDASRGSVVTGPNP